jgi:asparagine synthetase B (glutamine-hydrolysing)
MAVFYLVAMGDREEVDAWGHVVAGHAAVLGLVATASRWTRDGGAALLVAVIDHTDRAFTNGAFTIHGSDVRPASATSVSVDSSTWNVTVRVPVASPDQAYVGRGSGCSWVTNDLRLAVARQPLELDPCGVYALLQYGAVPAPFTLFPNLERVCPGHQASLGSPAQTPIPLARVPDTEPGDQATTAAIVARLDDAILQAPRPRAIFFSGGVDSGLIAARAAAAGLRDVLLLNYAFGPDDPEATHAARMAAALDLPLERIEDAPHHAVAMLERVAFDYAYPFGDFSTLPTNLLVRAMASSIPPGSLVLDGTGADGSFEKGFTVARELPIRALLRFAPARVGDLAGQLHARAGMITSESRLAALIRRLRLMTMMPPIFALVIAQHSLHGDAFYTARPIRDAVDRELSAMMTALSPSPSTADLATTLDVVHVCAGIYAAKDFHPLRHRRLEVLYPFLYPDVLAATEALPWTARCAGGVPKGLLKRALELHVSPSMIYRPKGGFTPPIWRVLERRDVRAFIEDQALRRDSSIAHFLRWGPTTSLFERAFRGERLNQGAHNFLWILAFAGSWLEGLGRLRTMTRVGSRSTV